MSSLGSLGFANGNHLMRAFDLQRREMLLGLDLFQPALCRGNASFVFFSIFGLYSLAAQLLGVILNLALVRACFPVNCADCVNESLPGLFFEPQTRDLLSDFQSRPGEFPLESQQLL